MKKLVAGLVLAMVVFSGAACADDDPDNTIILAVVLGYQKAVLGEDLMDVIDTLEDMDIKCSGIKCVQIAVAIQDVIELQHRVEERGLEW
jgi:hypothetical protein